MVSGTRQDNLFNIDHGKALAPHREAEDKFPLCRSLIRSLAIPIFGSPLFEGDGEPDYASLEFIYWRGLAQELELPKLTFQVIRRTIATLAQKKGTVKDIQGVLRHSRTATTTDVYMQEIPESVQKTVDAISAELRLLPNLEEVTGGTRVLLPNATKLKSGVSARS